MLPFLLAHSVENAGKGNLARNYGGIRNRRWLSGFRRRVRSSRPPLEPPLKRKCQNGNELFHCTPLSRRYWVDCERHIATEDSMARISHQPKSAEHDLSVAETSNRRSRRLSSIGSSLACARALSDRRRQWWIRRDRPSMRTHADRHRGGAAPKTGRDL